MSAKTNCRPTQPAACFYIKFYWNSDSLTTYNNRIQQLQQISQAHINLKYFISVHLRKMFNSRNVLIFKQTRSQIPTKEQVAQYGNFHYIGLKLNRRSSMTVATVLLRTHRKFITYVFCCVSPLLLAEKLLELF